MNKQPPVDVQNGMVRGRQNSSANAPSFAYYIVYGKYPQPMIWGRETSHPTKDINGVPIDQAIPDNAIKKLMALKGIESRASCQGEDTRHVTFFIFRPLNQNEQYVKMLCDNIKKQGLKCQYDIGWANQYRIGIAEKLWYDDKNKAKFIKWWNDLPIKLKRALQDTERQVSKLKEFFKIENHNALLLKESIIKVLLASKSILTKEMYHKLYYMLESDLKLDMLTFHYWNVMGFYGNKYNIDNKKLKNAIYKVLVDLKTRLLNKEDNNV